MEHQIDIDEIFRIVGKHVVEKELSIKSMTIELEQKNKLIAEQQKKISDLETVGDKSDE